MNRVDHLPWFVMLIIALSGCSGGSSEQEHHDHDEPHDDAMEHSAAAGQTDPAKGPNGGRLLVDGDFALELAIFESGVPPEFRVWATDGGQAVAPNEVSLHVTLTRLGNVKDEIQFFPQGEFLRGDTVVYEPHSFLVAVEAQYRGSLYRWEYENFEGRTRIESDVAEEFGIETEIAGPTIMRETVRVYGQVVANQERIRHVSARFNGEIESVRASLGDRVRKGQTLAVVESNESLRSYTVISPIEGIITERRANPGEQAGDLPLFMIIDTSSVWAEFAVFPRDLVRVKLGSPIVVQASPDGINHLATVAQLNTVAQANQAVLARVVLDNADGMLVPGMYLTGEIEIAKFAVPVAVKRTGLQTFRDFTVVYARVGDTYEVRMLDLGRQDAEWVEVLGGLDAGTLYVTKNSYLLKADVEKSGATHDH